MNKLKPFAAAAALVASGLVSAATHNNGGYTITYDESTSFGAISGFSMVYVSGLPTEWSFSWQVPTDLALAHNGGAASSVTFALPSFKLTANDGYELRGILTSSLGNIVYAEFNGATAMSADATVRLHGTVDIPLGPTPLTKTPTNSFSGFFSGSVLSAPLTGVQTIEVKNASVTLSATAGSFAAITGQTQNQLSFTFHTITVPEPETYAMLLAGLGVMGFVARRRQAR